MVRGENSGRCVRNSETLFQLRPWNVSHKPVCNKMTNFDISNKQCSVAVTQLAVVPVADRGISRCFVRRCVWIDHHQAIRFCVLCVRVCDSGRIFQVRCCPMHLSSAVNILSDKRHLENAKKHNFKTSALKSSVGHYNKHLH